MKFTDKIAHPIPTAVSKSTDNLLWP